MAHRWVVASAAISVEEVDPFEAVEEAVPLKAVEGPVLVEAVVGAVPFEVAGEVLLKAVAQASVGIVRVSFRVGLAELVVVDVGWLREGAVVHVERLVRAAGVIPLATGPAIVSVVEMVTFVVAQIEAAHIVVWLAAVSLRELRRARYPLHHRLS